MSVFGFFNADQRPCSDLAYLALHAMQHRGQDGAGLAGAIGDTILSHKNIGLVSEVFPPDTLPPFDECDILLGNTQYATSRASKKALNTQPLVMYGFNGFMALAHNGRIVGAQALRAKLQEEGTLLQTNTDAEVFMHLIAKGHAHDLPKDVAQMMTQVSGSYALVIMAPGMLLGARDPNGIRPLCIGKLDNAYILASESCAFEAMGGQLLREVAPGEIVWIDNEGLHSMSSPCQTQNRLCVFEYVYLARASSIMEEVEVYEARLQMGRTLARLFPVEADIVAGVPDSAIPAAIGYALESGIPYGQALLRNPYTGRTFIQPGQSARERSVRMKLGPVRSQVEGKRVVLVDDSIVRGTNSILLVDMLRHAGASQVHMRIASPPVMHPCHLGINTPNAGQLIGAQQDVEEIRKMIGADSLSYLPFESLSKAVCDHSLCGGCFTGEYPLPLNG